MANYPVGISLNGGSISAVILELTDDVIENIITSPQFGSGYVRQKGALVDGWAIDDFVQYDSVGQRTFQQGGITFAFVWADKILFKQVNVP